jgi:integrase
MSSPEMPVCKLSKRAIDALPCPADRDTIWWDEDLKGLGLKITPAGRRTFLVQYRPAGDRRNPRKYTIGEYGSVTPFQARVEAQRVLADRAAGRDPQAEKRESMRRLQSDNVANLVAEFISRHVSQNRTARETTRILHREVLPVWGTWTIHEVRKRDVVALLDKVRERGAAVMANRVLAVVRKFFNWCIGRGVLEQSPCANIGVPTREQSRHRILVDEELRSVITGGRTIGFPFGSIVELLALTGQRRDEVSRMAWHHVDIDRHLWVIPPEHSKNGKPHIVHLSDQAIFVLRHVPRTGTLVFSLDGTTPFQGYSKAKKRLDQASGVSGWTLHDLRRTVVSGMARLGVAPQVADKILNHQSGTISGVAAVYQRHEFFDERRAALCRWGQHVANLTASEACLSSTPELERAA